MPRKKLGDENADARRRVNMARSGAVASIQGDIARAKNLLPTSTGHSATGRHFARDVKNISRRPLTTVTSTNDAGLRSEEAIVFDQLSVDLGALKLRSVDGANNAQVDTTCNKARFDRKDLDIQPATLFSREAFSSSSSSYRLADGIEARPTSKRDTASPQVLPSRFSRKDRSSIDAMKRSSFRSASIVSQSTPLLKKAGRRSIRPFRPLDDDSEIYARYSLGSNSQQWHASDNDTEYCRVEPVAHNSQETGSFNEVMTQLASQLTEVVLSPCITPVPDDGIGSPLEESEEVSQGPACSEPRLKGRAGSFSLGFIPVAFSEEIDIKYLRISV